jgi:hypothetical protein
MASSYLPERDRRSARIRTERWRMRHRERQEALNDVCYALTKYEIDRKPCERCGTDRNVVADEITLHPKLRVTWRCRLCANARRRVRKSVAENPQPESESVSIVRRED